MVPEGHPSSDELEAYSLGLSSGADLENVQEHLLICERCQNELTLRDRFRPIMPPVESLAIESLEWDSKFFGFEIGQISLRSAPQEQLSAMAGRVSATVGWADKNGPDCLYWLIDGGDAISSRAAEACGFHLVDVQMTFETKLPRGTGLDQSLMARVRLVEPGDLPSLLALARRSHRDSRFFYDGNFGDDRCASFYEEWIKRGLRRDSDVVFVAEHESQPAGYCVCHLPGDQIGNIGLIAVAPEYQRCSIGTALVSAGLGYFERSGMRCATVVTQGRNIASQRLYQRCGFVTRSMRLWYHRWSPTRVRSGTP
jgi:dTDP-4-amino-4,6-dideoxy-D-galactose acyltransferase